LDCSFNVNQGIVTGADKVSRKHLEKFQIDAKKGDGIFALSQQEVKALNLSKSDAYILKPWFKNSDVKAFSTSNKAIEFLVYLDKRQFSFASLPKILRQHIARFEEVIANSVCNPPYLHRPRNEEIFLGAKIVAPQRSRMNTFGYNEQPWYAASDVFFITQATTAVTSLKSCLGLISSKLYFCWLYFRGKRKGESLEMIQKPLSEIPLPDLKAEVQRKFESVVDKLIANNSDEAAFELLNRLVFKFFELTEEEVNAVNAFYASRLSVSDSDETSNSEDLEGAA
jgi:adenine-specific DNA-methyltransferase